MKRIAFIAWLALIGACSSQQSAPVAQPVRANEAQLADGSAAQGARSEVDEIKAMTPQPVGAKFARERRDLASIAAVADPGAFNTEEYGHFVDNAFRSAEREPLSTFSIDVDRASYGNIRRFISGGQRPPIDAVRIEEMVNYFPYAYPEPTGAHPFSITTEIATAPWNTKHLLMRVGLKGRSVHNESLPAANLVFLIDVSGSMMDENKLPLVKKSLRMLVGQLRPQDRVSLVVYAGAAGLVLPSTSGEHKPEILDAIDRLEAGGSTAGAEGIRLAYQVARKHLLAEGNNRVILATDGDFNVGIPSDGELVRLIEAERAHGVFLTVLGFGTGNVKDSKMEQLADKGNGNYAYVDSENEAKKVLVTEMGGTLLTIAKDVKIQVEFNPSRVRGYRLVGYENRMLAAEDFNDDTKDAGELGAGHTVTALYEVIPAGVDTGERIRGVDSLRYQQAPPSAVSSTTELAFVKLRYKQPTGATSQRLDHPVGDATIQPSVDLRFASAVAGFGMLLRESEHRGTWTMDDVLATARGALGSDDNGYRKEFVELVGKVQKSEMLAKR